jgi:hypothetical protein
MPTAAEYAEALHTADMLAFIGEKLTTLYAGIMLSMPVYRIYTATSERDAIELWWPWGRPPPLVDGGPAKPLKPRKKVLDPSIITATRPQDVVREVMRRTRHQPHDCATHDGEAAGRQACGAAKQGIGTVASGRSKSGGGAKSRSFAGANFGDVFPTKKGLSDSEDIDLDCVGEDKTTKAKPADCQCRIPTPA